MAQATSHFNESLRRFRQGGDIAGIFWAHYDLSCTAMGQGEYAKAAALMEEGLAVAHEQGVPGNIGSGIMQLGRIAMMRGQYAEATTFFEESLPWVEYGGSTTWVQMANIEIGRAALLQGDLDEAARHYRAALALFEHNESVWGMALCLQGLAWTAYREQNLPRAARLLGAVESVRGHTTDPLQLPVDKGMYEQLQVALLNDPTPGLEKAWAEGRAMTLEQAITDALAEDPTAD